MLQSTFDIGQFENILDDLEDEVEEAIEDGLDAAAKEFFDEKLEKVERTYNNPPPIGKNGKPLWEQTGAWREGQRIETEPGERRIVDTGDPAEPITNYEGGYAERLGELNSARRNDAAGDAFEDAEDDAHDAFDAAVEKRLGR